MATSGSGSADWVSTTTTGPGGVGITYTGTGNLNSMTRKRLVELTKLAKDTVDSLEKKGVTRDEACAFGQMCEKMFEL